MDFSVVICTFNRSAMLAEAIESVARQTCRDFELIVVDDGSTDDTAEVVERFRARVPGLVFTQQAQRGPAQARNVGASLASGDYLAFLDSDDLWAPNYLTRMRRMYSRQNGKLDGAFANGWVISDSGKMIRAFFPASIPATNGTHPSSSDLFNFFPFVTTSALTVRRTAFLESGGFDARFTPRMEDWHWLIHARLAGLRFARIEDTLVLYREHAGNLTRDAASTFEAWLDLCAAMFPRTKLDHEQSRHVLRFTRARIPALLATSKADRAREVLHRAKRELPTDLLLDAARLSTYFGATELLRLLRFWKICRAERRDVQPAYKTQSQLFSLLDRMGEGEKDLAAQAALQGSVTTQTLSIVIATTEGRNTLDRCLRSVEAQQRAGVEIIVVLNGPRNEAFAQAMAARGVKALFAPKRGVSRARNAGVAVAVGEIVAFLDDDVEAHSGWAEAMLAGFDDPKVACVTGCVVPDGPTYLARERHERWYSSPQATTTWTLEPGSPDWVWKVLGQRVGFGCNMAFRRSFLTDRVHLPEDLGAGTLIGAADEDFMFLQVLKHRFALHHAGDATVTHFFDSNVPVRKRREAEFYAGSAAFLLKLLAEERGIRGQVLRSVLRAFARKAMRTTGRAPANGGSSELLSYPQKLGAFMKGVSVYLASRREARDGS